MASPAIVEPLGDVDLQLPMRAVLAILAPGKVGRRSKEAIAALIALLGDDSPAGIDGDRPSVSAVVQRMLASLQPESPLPASPAAVGSPGPTAPFERLVALA